MLQQAALILGILSTILGAAFVAGIWALRVYVDRQIDAKVHPLELVIARLAERVERVLEEHRRDED